MRVLPSSGSTKRRVLVALGEPLPEFAALARLERAGLELVDGYDLPESPDGYLEPRLAGIWGVVAGGQYFTRKVLEARPEVRVIARLGVGYDRIDVEAAGERGVAITITPNGNASSVADFTLGLMLAVLREIPRWTSLVASGGWRGGPPTRDLYGATVGVLGFGRIGQRVASRLRGFECRILAHDPLIEPGSDSEPGVEFVDFARLLAEVDVLTLHVPLSDATRGIIGSREMEAMRQGAILINTARGPLVDERALVDSLRAGHLGGAGIDVFELEPLPESSPLRQLPQVVLTGHVASHSSGAMRGMMEEAVDSILALAGGELPSSCVNPDAVRRAIGSGGFS